MLRSLAPYLVALFGLSTLLLLNGYLYLQHHKEAELIAEQHGIALDVAYRAALEIQRVHVAHHQQRLTSNPGLLELLQQAQGSESHSLPALRGRLYRLLNNDYQQMRAAGLSHLYLYQHDGTTLLRFHAPTISGDAAQDWHRLLQQTIDEQRPQSGFAIGRLNTMAFRYLYPLSPNGEQLGTLEIALPFERLHEDLIRLAPTGDYTILVNRLSLREQANLLHGEKYIASPLGSLWLQEHPTISRITRDFVRSPLASELLPKLAHHHTLQQQMHRGESISIPLRHHGQGYVVTSYAVHNPQGEAAAWILGISHAPVLQTLFANTRLSMFGASLLSLLLTLASWVILRQHKHLHALSHVDGLTGIANRRTFDQTLEQEWQRAHRSQSPLAVLLIDIDYFKHYNDHYGHQAGDRCLRRVAHTLQSALSRPEDLAARYGGEEFVCLLPNTYIQGATKVAERLREAVQELQLPHVSSPVCPHLTISIGVAVMTPTDSLAASQLIHQADEQLYAAKEIGRNCVAY